MAATSVPETSSRVERFPDQRRTRADACSSWRGAGPSPSRSRTANSAGFSRTATRSSFAASASDRDSPASASASVEEQCSARTRRWPHPEETRTNWYHLQRLRGVTMQSIETRDAPAAGGHYSQAVVHNGVVYVAGQLPIKPGSSERHVGSIEEQTEQTLRNVEAILN